MAVTAQTIVSRVRTQVIDLDGTRWSDTELLKWLSDGQRTLVAYSPGISSISTIASLVAGTQQTIPANGHMLLSLLRNIKSDGVTPGRACRVVSRELLDSQNADWHASTASPTVQDFIYDPQEPLRYYVYPPNDGNGKVEMIYSVMPVDLTALTDTLVVQDIYQTALFDYVMFRAHQKDSDFAAGQAVAATYWAAFAGYVGQGDKSALEASPNQQLAPPNPAIRGAAK